MLYYLIHNISKEEKIMVKTVEISDELYARLGSQAQGFDDTPEDVIGRLVNGQTASARPLSTHRPPAPYGSKDTTKYIFNGYQYGKGRLVLAVVTEYVKQNPDITFNELKKVFPDQLQGANIGVFAEIEDAKRRTNKIKRYYFGDRPGSVESVQIADCTIVVSNQWGIGNIGRFLQVAEKLGFEINPV